ncbi:hypothetical protein ElyMa_005960100 [Elysia marginata]|uniref:Uncharacterized protein n=1 Tax=Elysia marginata TaxID=1093978 RepID=A0AAV4GCD2_9GAST|nr:hypothetical protein ElyMa_005960100 [Elysia marginata]
MFTQQTQLQGGVGVHVSINYLLRGLSTAATEQNKTTKKMARILPQAFSAQKTSFRCNKASPGLINKTRRERTSVDGLNLLQWPPAALFFAEARS